MCLVSIAFKVHPDYPLLLVGNRDEFYERPTQRAHWWENHPNIFAGKDLKAGGTWMGINQEGQFAVLTNFRMGREQLPNARSRGELVSDYLLNSPDPVGYMEELKAKAANYNLFNLIVGNQDQMVYYSNAGDKPLKIMGQGVYGLSNSFLDVPWPKVKKARMGMTKSLQNSNFIPRDLFSILTDKTVAADEELPDTQIPYEWEKRLSAMFIELPNYGTRVTTLIAMDKSGKLSMEERSVYQKESDRDNKYSSQL
ncbi:MAG: NRDE family protein [Bacteroidia bacterium]|nr:NRDE family protein [Bacteroidia bacterium]